MSIRLFGTNPWRLCNAHGNVWQMTEHCWNEKNAGNRGDGKPGTTVDCSLRVLRGACFSNFPRPLRSARRDRRRKGASPFKTSLSGLRGVCVVFFYGFFAPVFARGFNSPITHLRLGFVLGAGYSKRVRPEDSGPVRAAPPAAAATPGGALRRVVASVNGAMFKFGGSGL
jgi:hypothetical protein